MGTIKRMLSNLKLPQSMQVEILKTTVYMLNLVSPKIVSITLHLSFLKIENRVGNIYIYRVV